MSAILNLFGLLKFPNGLVTTAAAQRGEIVISSGKTLWLMSKFAIVLLHRALFGDGLRQSGVLLPCNGSRLLPDSYLSDALTRKYAATDKPRTRTTPKEPSCGAAALAIQKRAGTA